VTSSRRQDGRWPLNDPHHDPVDFDMEGGGGAAGGAGEPSRWNTLRALRMLEWYSAHETR
jgi:hypothetical protein